jgi:1-acyl-sn-glycerol-3-phosphate acyltransferase
MNLNSLRNIRAAYRLTRTGLHLLQGAATVALVYPWISEPRRLALKRRWSRQLLTVLGVRLDISQPGELMGLVVANHVSFLDIYVINALAPAAFVSKDDVRTWPLIGWLCEHTDTIFLQRGNRNAAHHARHELAQHLAEGRLVALFPEGTTTTGDHVLPFHSALLQSAVDTGAPITPVVLRYEDGHGTPCSDAAYVGDTSLLECLWSIASCRNLVACTKVLEPMASNGQDRRHLAAEAHRRIAQGLARQLSPSRSASPVAHRGTDRPAGHPGAPPSIGLPTGIPNPMPADSLPA